MCGPLYSFLLPCLPPAPPNRPTITPSVYFFSAYCNVSHYQPAVECTHWNLQQNAFSIFRPFPMLLDPSSPISCWHCTGGIHTEGTICLTRRMPGLSCCNQHHLEKVYLITQETGKNYLLMSMHNKPACHFQVQRTAVSINLPKISET